MAEDVTAPTSGILKLAAMARKEGYEFGLRYVIEQRPETIAKIKELRERAELLEWAASGSEVLSSDIDAVIG